MHNVLDVFTHILKEHLTICFVNKKQLNPIDTNKERFLVRGIFTATIIFLKHNTIRNDVRVVFHANNWLKSSFSDDNLFSKIIDNAPNSLIKLIDDSLGELTKIELIDVPSLYETLLSIETSNENYRTKSSTAKNYRNKLGSYYTPADLAQSVTEKTIDAFIDLNFGINHFSNGNCQNSDKSFLSEISSIRFADFSCGGGVFLIEVLCYFEKIFHMMHIEDGIVEDFMTSIVLNISAFDVDCQALELAKINLLLKIQQPSLYKRVKANFIHANFLLQSNFDCSDSIKIHLFSSGYIYHEQLSLDRNKLKKYDVILGNPPWGKIRFEEKKFYALYENSIASNHFKSSRTDQIEQAKLNNIQLAEFSKNFKFEIDKAKIHLKNNSFFNLSHKGELNTYALFTDAAIKLRSKRGVVGLILKSAIISSQVNQTLFGYLSKENKVISIFDFINRNKIFNIDSRERFCFLLLGNSKKEQFRVAMNMTNAFDINETKLNIELSYESLQILNPVTGMLPNFSTEEEADFILRVSRENPFFKNVFNKVRFGRIVHFTSHTKFISKKQLDDNTPIYEGKFFHQFDGKYSGFNEVEDKLRYSNKASSVLLNDHLKEMDNYFPESRFFIDREKWRQLSKNHNAQFMLVWRSLTSATNTRTCIATLLPFIPASQSVQFLTTNQNDLFYLAGLFNSVVFDFILKKKLSGIDLTQSVINQMPIPSPKDTINKIEFGGRDATIKEHISYLVSLLFKNDSRLKPLHKNLKFNTFNVLYNSRYEITKRIDLLFMFLYKLNDSEIQLVLTVFSKQYSASDLTWFTNKLDTMQQLNKTICPSSGLVAHLSPS